ncbi:MAG: hypothetical protein J6386_02940 [Candidatus Synoicihabitans palmerolidicus]|nr:hypothetical protein [Candidatus Synoicihabitans palmerolidicus]
MAREFSERLNQTQQELCAVTNSRDSLTADLDDSRNQDVKFQSALVDRQKEITALSTELETTRATFDRTANDLNATTTKLSRTTEDLAVARERLTAIESSLLWRWGKPWRALFGPKV